MSWLGLSPMGDGFGDHFSMVFRATLAMYLLYMRVSKVFYLTVVGSESLRFVLPAQRFGAIDFGDHSFSLEGGIILISM